ncbi:hypothetical protein Peur_069424 [Populus x canadensis]|jgi:hypothetical protein
MEGDLDTLTFGPLLLSPFHTVVTVDGGVANEARGFDGTVSWCYCVCRGFNSIGGRSLCYFASLIPFLSLLTPLQISRNNTELEALVKLKSTLDPTNKDFYSHGLMMVTPAVAYFEGVACNELGKMASISLQ